MRLKTDARNEYSPAAIARLGAVRERVLRAHMVMPDGWGRYTVMFAIVAAEWPAVRARLGNFCGDEPVGEAHPPGRNVCYPLDDKRSGVAAGGVAGRIGS